MADYINITSVLYAVYIFFTIILAIRILLDNNSPEVAVAWLLSIVFLPYIGAALYVLGGINWKKHKIWNGELKIYGK